MTAHPDTDTAVEALQRGAYDYLRKPFKIPDFLATLDRAFAHVSLSRDKARAERELEQTNETLSLLNHRLRGIVETATRVAGVASIEELSGSLLEIFASHLGAGGGSLFRKEPYLLRLEHTLDPPHVPDLVELPPRADSVLARAFAAKGSLLLTDAGSSGWDGYSDGSCLVFTINAKGEGAEYVLTLHNPVSPPFTGLDLEIGSLLSSFLSEVMRSLRTLGALRQQEALYRYLFERSHAMHIVLSKEGKLVSLNQNALERLGYELAEITGMDPTALIVEEDRGLAAARLREVLARREITTTELRVRATDGSIRLLYFPSGSGVVVEEPNVEPRILLTALDMTERKQEEEALFQASKLVSLGTLASGIAHEVNNPNSYIRMNAQNLTELCRRLAESGGQSDDSSLAQLLDLGSEMLDGIVEGSKRIESLVGQLREFVRQEPQSLVQRVDLNEVVASSIELLKPLVHRATESFHLSLAEELPTVRGDCHQLEQVVMNLVSNACQAVEETRGNVEVATGRKGEELFLSVCDNGPGIPAANIERVKDPFFTTKRAHGGTGLGLSVTARVVERHSGRLVFESNEAGGTIATVWLPIEEPKG
jgi:PAS domain S-box-containing protein